MAGFRELLAVEWDDNAVETFKLNFPGVPVYHGDIAKLSVEECLRLANLEPGQLDVLDGSPPCQGFSTAGKRQMDDPRNSLFQEYVRLLRGLRPKAFVMENVSGLIKGKMKLVFAEIMRELKASGYKVRCRLLNAMYYNVPQSRQRLIWIGIRDDLAAEPSHPKAESRPVSGNGVISELRAARFLSWRGKHKRDTVRPLGALPTAISRKGIDLEGRKLYANPSGVKLFFSFPPDMRFEGTATQQLMRIGNSVPPLFMRAIAGHVRILLQE